MQENPFDWADHWRKLVNGREAQAQRLRERAGLTAANFWDQRAEGFRRATQSRAGEQDPLLALVSPHLTSETTVLDAGAGVGRHTLPLAGMVRSVTAVEPSEGMRSFLAADAAEQAVRNVTIVPAAWEDADAQVEPCDIAICSHVVYFVADIRLFLEKLQKNAKKHCFMVIRTTQRDGHLAGLWQRVHGEALVPETGAIDLFNAVYQCLGVIPNVEVTPFRVGRGPMASYASLDEALKGVREQLYLAPGDPRESIIREHLGANIVEQEGRYVLPGRSTGAAILWWSNEPGSWNRVE